jgi:phosphoglycolate phosphatase-like HAD superfamily hydrolase
MKPKLIFYDFDGVICDSVNIKTEAFAELYKQYGLEIQEKVVRYHIENGGISRFEKIKYFQKNLLFSNISENEISIIADRFQHLVKEKVINSAYINGVEDFIKNNSTNTLQFICTGTPETEILEIVKRRGLTPYFKGVFGSPNTKSEIIKKVLKTTNIEVSKTIFIGDAMTDYKAALENNIPFIGIKSEENIFPIGTIVINDFKDNKLKNIFYENN